jgi:hypothetical protein
MMRLALRTVVLGLSISGAALGEAREEDAAEPAGYDASGPMAARYEPQVHPRWGLVITGGVLFSAGYTFAVVGALDAKLNGKGGFLFIPVLGPWLTLAAGGAKDGSSRTDPGVRFTLGLDGVVQAAGAIMLTAGIVFPRRRQEPTEMSLRLLPVALGNGGYGAGLLGAF